VETNERTWRGLPASTGGPLFCSVLFRAWSGPPSRFGKGAEGLGLGVGGILTTQGALCYKKTRWKEVGPPRARRARGRSLACGLGRTTRAAGEKSREAAGKTLDNPLRASAPSQALRSLRRCARSPKRLQPFSPLTKNPFPAGSKDRHPLSPWAYISPGLFNRARTPVTPTGDVHHPSRVERSAR
jgi:hypothetical protein